MRIMFAFTPDNHLFTFLQRPNSWLCANNDDHKGSAILEYLNNLPRAKRDVQTFIVQSGPQPNQLHALLVGTLRVCPLLISPSIQIFPL